MIENPLVGPDGRLMDFNGVFDAVAGRDADGHYPNFNEALLAINCMDEQRSTPEEQVAVRQQNQQAAPFTDPGQGPAGARDMCEFWPAEPTLGYPYAAGIEGLPDTLTISMTGDPSTPYDGGVSLADTLGGSLLTVEGEQHTVAFPRQQLREHCRCGLPGQPHDPSPQARCTL